jgi:hypothetical protein
MRGIVLPSSTPLHLGAVKVPVDIGSLVDVDVHVAATPVAVAEDGPGSGQADAPCKASGQRCTRIVGRIWWPVVRWIGGRAPGAVDNGRIVGRHVNDLRVRGLNPHNSLAGLPLDRSRRRLHDHVLLLVRLEVPRLLRSRPQPLHRRQHILLLGEEGIAQLLRPVELVVHRLTRLGKRH